MTSDVGIVTPARVTASYPLTGTWLLFGGLAGMTVAVLADDGVAGYAVFVLLATIGLTWRRDDPPIFPFILGYQWLAVTAGYWFEQVTGSFPGLYRPGDTHHTSLVALTGLLLLALGIRGSYHGLTAWREHRSPVAARSGGTWEIVNIRLLFVLVIAAYAADYLWLFNTRLFAGLDVALQRVLDFRQVLLVVLLAEVLRRKAGYPYLWVALAWAFVSRLGAYFSDFKSPVILLLIIYAATFRPWDRQWWPKSLLAVAKMSPALVVLVVVLLIWQGGLKHETREAIDNAHTPVTPAERVTTFAEGVRRDLPQLFADPEPYVEKLVERLSYITFLSLVFDYVPSREPHAGGELLRMAVTNSTMPRYFFPEKPVLPSDSYYTRRFAGVAVAEELTSISIGYMAEFYADWGYGGMWLSIFLYGCWIGMMAAVIRFVNPMPALRSGLLIVAMLVVADFEHQFIKGFAALNASVLFLLLLTAVLKPVLTRTLGVRPVVVAGDDGEIVRSQPVEGARPSFV
ncbi:MAG TPA: hypothetical protein VMM93_04945 [Vicinamibacterales bacterium]|nr:hypothetical protein [Vicinamibacterales bacterium]